MTEPLPPISIDRAMAGLTFLPDRTPEGSVQGASGAFAELAGYRDGGIFVGHWAGASEWERHGAGDEVVMVVDGETTIFLLTGVDEVAHRLGPGDLVVVPQGTWHRFETPRGVKVLSVTPQPTDHRAERPD